MFFPTTLHEAQALADRLARDNPSYELTVDGDHQLIRVSQRERLLGRGWVCPRCGSADVRVLDGWLSRWWGRVWRLTVWGTALAALLYCTRV